ncbi:hypothetical protein KAR91_11795 [Candidatus Pacearchaeota archaeon]|nr:hypothetical protein [Candidatus Pacearchaeota archaeon]
MARPKETWEDKGVSLEQVERIAGHFGATDAELAYAFDVCEDTINEWKKKFPEFNRVLKRAKNKADKAVVKSLYKQACGYTVTEKTVEKNCAGAIVKTVTTKKHIQPSKTAQIFWLKNRQPQDWRDVKDHNHKGLGGTVNNNLTINIDSQGLLLCDGVVREANESRNPSIDVSPVHEDEPVLPDEGGTEQT